MIEPWFPREVAPYFAFVSLFAFAAGLEVFAKRGQHRAAVMAISTALIGIGAVVLLIGLVAAMVGQPRFVTGPLLMAGGVLTTVCVGGLIQLRQIYAETELRKMAAEDI